MEKNEKIQELLKNEEFLKMIIAMNPEEAQKAFAAKGVDLSIDEITSAGDIINTVLQNDGELNEAALAAVAGGGKVGSFLAGFVIGAGIAAGAAVVGAACCVW